jgi:isoleucyl-tRNA synthetase
LPSNLGLAVGSDIDYAILEEGANRYIIAEAALPRYEVQLKNATKVASLKGGALVGRRYAPLFPYFKDHPKSFVIMAGDFVTTEDGTGIVHMAPGFGEDDQRLCEANGITVVVPVDERGRFTMEVQDFQGQQVHDAQKEIIRTLKDKGVLIRHDTITHNYPHCWRTDTPIIYRAMSSWYVKVTNFKDRMVELNQKINWIPDHIKDGQFGKWLENARDWSISRNRFWGAPIPVWKSDNPKFPRVDVYGSLDEIEKDFGVRPTNLHRPFIDQLTRPNPDDPSGKSTMRRVDEVLDCWFESGSMPFASIHYPFENKQWFDTHFPADFIVEYIAQTRGWFYTLMVLGVALFDRPPFLNCICHGVVLDENGQKLSKRLRNYPDPEEVCNTIGADALRWFLIASPILRGLDLQIDREGKAIGEIVRTVLNPIWNAYYFFTLYANADGITAKQIASSENLLDRYILSKTGEFVAQVTTLMDRYDLAGACQTTTSFLSALNNWYIRRSRERFWKQEIDADKQAAYDTLYTVLVTLCKVAAPLLPMITEEIYRGLTGETSVHLAHWPTADAFTIDHALVREMDRVRDVCSAGLALREANNLRIRLPLQTLTLAGKDVEKLLDYAALIRDELNVKKVEVSTSFDAYASYQLQVNARELGPKLGAAMKDVLKATRDGSWKVLPDGSAVLAGVTLQPGDFELRIMPKAGVASQGLPSNDAVVVLDTKLTPELEEEGLARDLVRMVQQARKEAGLHVSDSIKLEVHAPQALETVIRKHERYLADQTLAANVAYAAQIGSSFSQNLDLGGHAIKIGIEKS